MTELREKLNNIVEDYNACKVLAKSVGNPSVYEGTTATAEDIILGKTAYSNGKLLEGKAVKGVSFVVSEEEPTGDNKAKFWVKQGKNLADMDDFQTYSVVAGSGTSATISGNDIKVNTYWKNQWTAGRFRSIDLRGYEGKTITVSLEIKETNSQNGGFLLGTCNENVENRQTIIDFYMFTKNDGRVSLTAQVPDTITAENQYLYIQLNATGSYVPTTYNTYTTYTNIQIELGNVATEYEPFYEQELFIKNIDDEYVVFDKDTKF